MKDPVGLSRHYIQLHGHANSLDGSRADVTGIDCVTRRWHRNGGLGFWKDPMMPCPFFPPELLDIIVDFLCTEPKALQNCCLVAKSWVPHTRKHLFVAVAFPSPQRLESWKKTFPDPSNSPAHYTRYLSIRCPHIITVADAEEGGWIRTFSRVVCLDMVSSLGQDLNDSEVSLIPFHGFSPVIKSFRLFSVQMKHSQIFDLICSLPTLEDLILVTLGIPDDENPTVGGLPTETRPPGAPVLTGDLKLVLPYGMESIARRLLSIPSGLHFRHLMISCRQECDLRWVNALVLGCSATLENLVITCDPLGMILPFFVYNVLSLVEDNPSSPPVDLSAATRLKDADLWSSSLHVQWTTATLRTITSNHRNLQAVSIHVAYEYDTFGPGADIRQTIGEIVYGHWLDLDRFLIQFWESRSIRPKVTYSCTSQDEEKEAIDCATALLPETTRRRAINLVKYEEPR